MLSGKYRLTAATISVILQDGHHVAHTIPTGATITVPSGTDISGSRLIEVILDDKRIMMFAQDLRTRAVFLEP